MDSIAATNESTLLDPEQERLALRLRDLTERRTAELRSLRSKVFAALGVAALGLGLYASHFGTWRAFGEVVAAGLLGSGAAALAGSLLGFLFGIPRSASVDPRVGDALVEHGSSPGALSSAVRTTNLEQMSDWLTKILVGVGLTQLHELPASLRGLSLWLGESVPGQREAGPFLLGAMAYACVFGVLFGYIWTRMVLTPMFGRSDDQLRKAFQELTTARRSAQKALNQLAVAEHAAGQTFDLAQARAEAVVLNAKLHAEQLDSVLRKMLEGLYEPPERQGYAATIRTADTYVTESGDPDHFLFWLRYAAAQAQRATNEPEAYDEARGKALEAARKVLGSSPELGRYWLSLLWHPEHPQRILGEDDLQVFFDDLEFKTLIGDDPYIHA